MENLKYLPDQYKKRGEDLVNEGNLIFNATIRTPLPVASTQLLFRRSMLGYAFQFLNQRCNSTCLIFLLMVNMCTAHKSMLENVRKNQKEVI